MKTLASFSVASVFWTVPAREPISAREVAQEIGKSASSVHYHFEILRDQNLIIEVGQRKRHARTERLYVRSGVECRDEGPGVDLEYALLRAKGFAAAMRMMIRATELMQRVLPHKRDIWDFSAYQRVMVTLERSQALEVKQKLHELIEAIGSSVPADTRDVARVQLFAMMRPSQGQSAAWMKELGITRSPEPRVESEQTKIKV